MDLHISLTSHEHVSGAIYRQIRDAILDGRLLSDCALPSSRELARRLRYHVPPWCSSMNGSALKGSSRHAWVPARSSASACNHAYRPGRAGHRSTLGQSGARSPKASICLLPERTSTSGPGYPPFRRRAPSRSGAGGSGNDARWRRRRTFPRTRRGCTPVVLPLRRRRPASWPSARLRRHCHRKYRGRPPPPSDPPLSLRPVHR